MTEAAFESESLWIDSYQFDERELEMAQDLSPVNDPFAIERRLKGRLNLAYRFEGFSLLRWFQPIKVGRLVKKQQKAEEGYHSLPPGVRLQIGQQALARLGNRWCERNWGKFVAITLRGQLLAVCDTLAQVYETLGYLRPQEDYFVSRVGYPSVGNLV